MGRFDNLFGKKQNKEVDSVTERELFGKRYYLIKNKKTRRWDICTSSSHNPPLDKYRWAIGFSTEDEADRYLKTKTLHYNMVQNIIPQTDKPVGGPRAVARVLSFIRNANIATPMSLYVGSFLNEENVLAALGITKTEMKENGLIEGLVYVILKYGILDGRGSVLIPYPAISIPDRFLLKDSSNKK